VVSDVKRANKPARFDFGADQREDAQATLTNFMNVVDSQFDKETAGQLNSAITAMMLQSLPEMHALRREGFRPSRS
jgi:hypothetical protein